MPKPPPNRVQTVREARGLSQIALAAAAGLARQSVGAIEAGRATPAVDVALRLAKALGCRVEELFGAPEEPPLRSEPESPSSSTTRLAVAEIAGRWVSYPLDREGLGLSADALVVPENAGSREDEATRSPIGVHGARSSGAPQTKDRGAIGQGSGAPARDVVGRRGAQSSRKRTKDGAATCAASPTRSLSELRDNVVVMGCAAGLGLLADRLNARTGTGRFLWLSRSSTAALEALGRNQTHLAGVHLVDPRTGTANLTDVHRQARGAPWVVITLARWEAGLLTAPGNPKRIRCGAELARRGLRLAVREQGSGARRLLDGELRRAKLPASLATQAPVHAFSHLDVARAIALGAADTGVATRDAAIAFGLDFVPLTEERYDLALPRDGLADPRLQRLFDVMTAAPFRRELTSLGYDVRSCGDRVADLSAA